MKKILRLMLGLLLVVWFCLGSLGCLGGDQSGKANELIDKLNARVDKYNKLDKEAEDMMNTLNTDATTQDEAKKNLDILGEVDSMITKQEKALTEAAKLLDEAKKLDISDEFKKYVEMEQEANQADKELNKITKQILAELRKIYEAMSSPAGLSQEQSEAMNNTVQDLANKSNAQQEKASKLKDEAAKYYEDHNLGE